MAKLRRFFLFGAQKARRMGFACRIPIQMHAIATMVRCSA
jgi:hypothetical protein